MSLLFQLKFDKDYYKNKITSENLTCINNSYILNPNIL